MVSLLHLRYLYAFQESIKTFCGLLTSMPMVFSVPPCSDVRAQLRPKPRLGPGWRASRRLASARPRLGRGFLGRISKIHVLFQLTPARRLSNAKSELSRMKTMVTTRHK